MDWEPPVPHGYTDSNRAFLQALLSRGTLTFAEGQPVIASILSAESGGRDEIDPESVTEEQFRGFLVKARQAVSPLDYDIRSIKHQGNDQQVWALINMQSDPTTQLATAHTPEEIAFINRVLDAMFETYNTPRMEVMAITEQQAMKLARPRRNPNREVDANAEASPAPADKGLKHSEVERLLPSLVQEGWLEKSYEGFYSLSPRSMLELRSWMPSAYNDPDAGPEDWQRIKFCEACKEIVTVGQRCPNSDCNTRIHSICADRYWQSRREAKCPKCQTEWTGKSFVGEQAVTETEAFRRGRRRGSGRRTDIVDAILNPDEEDQEVGGDDD